MFENRAWPGVGVSGGPEEAGRRAICWGLPVMNDLRCRFWMFCLHEVTDIVMCMHNRVFVAETGNLQNISI